MNAWLKRCVFNLDLNRESVSEPRTFSGRLFHSYITIIYHLIVNICVNFTLDRAIYVIYYNSVWKNMSKGKHTLVKMKKGTIASTSELTILDQKAVHQR